MCSSDLPPLSLSRSLLQSLHSFTGYLSSPSTEGPTYDSTLLLSSLSLTFSPQILIDYGSVDNFYKQGQLLPEKFEEAARKKGLEGVQVREQEGYDHSYCE